MFARTFAGKTDGYRGNSALYRHHSKKINHPNVGTQRVSDEKKSSERREVCDQRNGECQNSSSPMAGIEMIRKQELDQPFARTEFPLEAPGPIKHANSKSRQ